MINTAGVILVGAALGASVSSRQVTSAFRDYGAFKHILVSLTEHHDTDQDQ
jgi:hypothetical protein